MTNNILVYISWMILELGLILLISVLHKNKLYIKKWKIILIPRIKPVPMQAFPLKPAVVGVLRDEKYRKLTKLTVIITSLVVFCIIFTWVLFKLFPTIPDAPNIITVFAGIFGILFGSIGLYDLFVKQDNIETQMKMLLTEDIHFQEFIKKSKGTEIENNDHCDKK